MLRYRAHVLIPKSQVISQIAPEIEHSSTQTSIPVFSNPLFQPNEISEDNLPVDDFVRLHPAVQSMFTELNHLSALMAEKSASSLIYDEKDSFNETLNIAEQRIFRITHCEPDGVNSPKGALFALRAYPTSGSIFLYLYLRKIPPSSTALDYFIPTLQDALIDGNVIDDRAKFPLQALLWVLFMGGIASDGRVQRQWFQEQASKTRTALGLDSWSAARQLLIKFPFTGADCELHYRKFWSELA
jgi:hypothetical protein